MSSASGDKILSLPSASSVSNTDELPVVVDGITSRVSLTNFLKSGRFYSGTGSPENVVTAAVGALYIQTDGANGKTLWRKRAGTGSIGWTLMQGDLGVFNVRDFGAVGNGTVDDGAALQAAIAAANATVLLEGSPAVRDAIGAVVYFPPGKYKTTLGLNPFPGVSIVGSGLWSTSIQFSRGLTADGIVWDRSATGYATYQGFGWGGALRDIKITTDNYKIAGASVGRMVSVKGVVSFSIDRVLLTRAAGRLLHIENVIALSMYQVTLLTNDGDCGYFIGTNGGSVSTTVRAYQVYQSGCSGGPGADVWGLSIDFFGCTWESNAVYGLRARNGTISLYSPYFEDNADADAWMGSDAVGVTAVTIVNPTLLVSASKIAGKGGIKLDRCSQANILGGDLSASAQPVEMTANCGQVVCTAYLGAQSPTLAAGAPWNTIPSSAAVQSDNFKSTSGSTSCPSGVATQLFNATTTTSGISQLHVYNNTGSGLSALADVYADSNGNYFLDQRTNHGITLSLVGASVKATQATGGTLTLSWRTIKNA